MEYGSTYEERDLLERRGSEDGTSDGRSSAELEALVEEAYTAYSYASIARSKWRILPGRRLRSNSKLVKAAFEYARPRRKRSLWRLLCTLLWHALYLIVFLLVIAGILFPSYSDPPQRYRDLRMRVEQSIDEGAANLNNEKIFIAATLDDQDGDLVSGHWGRSVLRLVDMLGHSNVFLSIYENDSDVESERALTNFRELVPCESSIVHEHLDLSKLPHMTMPDGSLGIKRIAFLSEIRNRALRPLDDVNSTAYHTQWDKLLYLNDIAFDPIDAANLLLNTHVDVTTGRSDYRAACAVDFIMPFKFYDTFATRDLEGFKMGTPFYPWFTNSGQGQSRRDVISQTDAVRVKSCWGGMAAFEAKWFQAQSYDWSDPGSTVANPSSNGSVREASKSKFTSATALPTLGSHKRHESADDSDQVADREESLTAVTLSPVDESSTWTSMPPLRFRFESDTYWDASECCLIHADIAERRASLACGHSYDDIGVYINPYIRVAYSEADLRWLPFLKRFERLYPLIHIIADWVAQVPKYNPRRLEQAGDEVINRVWRWDERSLEVINNGSIGDLHGSFVDISRTAQAGHFCGNRQLQYIKQDRRDGGRSWEAFKVPPE